MSKNKARDILNLAKTHAVQYKLYPTFHAREQMDERNATMEDVNRAIYTATDATYSQDEGTWRLTGGRDLDDREMIVAIAVTNERTRVVTVF